MSTDSYKQQEKAESSPLPQEIEWVEMLRQTALFSQLDQSELYFIANHSDLVTYAPQELIYREASPATALYMVLTGSPEVYDSENRLIAQIEVGDIFGELELFSGEKYASTVMAGKDMCKILSFPKKNLEFADLMQKKPSLTAQILKSFLILLAQRTRKANELVKGRSPWVRELQNQVYIDKLSGIHNRAFFEEKLQEHFSKNLLFILAKPDNFKTINDNFGHEAGDKVIIFMARALAKFKNKDEILARFEGNAFTLLCPIRERFEAEDRAKTLKDYMENLSLKTILDDPDFRLSLSLGLGFAGIHASHPAELIERVSPLPLIGRAEGGSLILWPEDDV